MCLCRVSVSVSLCVCAHFIFYDDRVWELGVVSVQYALIFFYSKKIFFRCMVYVVYGVCISFKRLLNACTLWIS